MHIKLSPVRMDESLSVSRAGDVLTINDTVFDLGPLPEGATLPAEAINSEWITGPVSRIDGELHLTLRLPHGPSPSRAVAFPGPIHVTEDGPIALPFDPPAEQESEISDEDRDGMAALGAFVAMSMTHGSLEA